MNNKLNQPILISIVTANSDKIFRTLDNNEARRKEVEKEFGIPTYNSLTEAKNLFEINSVFVCTSISIFMMKIPDLVMDIITI
ncbi:hypothetical protein EfmAA610_09560 [Enterococcus faecium]|nr:hypothetical protein EfmAA610_09560 [Enterococcus faecium]